MKKSIESRTTTEQYIVGHVIHFFKKGRGGQVYLTNVCTVGTVVHLRKTRSAGIIRTVAVFVGGRMVGSVVFGKVRDVGFRLRKRFALLTRKVESESVPAFVLGICTNR